MSVNITSMAVYVTLEGKIPRTPYWPKSTDFKKISQSAVQDVIVNLNDRPRKKLNYKTPAKLMTEHMVAMAA
ncbi:MAG: IS30 family transposase [Gammaproteobacteria bacterium]|jgi:IS30 family transposase